MQKSIKKLEWNEEEKVWWSAESRLGKQYSNGGNRNGVAENRTSMW